MTKYYRVRTQEQWEWLMHWFEEQDRKIRWIAGEKPTEDAVHLNYARIWVIQLDDNNRLSVGSNYQFTECDHITDFIETSKMMERYSLDNDLFEKVEVTDDGTK